MNEFLARSDRSTARGGLFRRRARLAPGPLRQAGPARPSSGVLRGMLTGALVALAVLAAFTLPFLRGVSDPAPLPPLPPLAARPALAVPAQGGGEARVAVPGPPTDRAGPGQVTKSAL